MRVPAMAATVERRLLVNYRVDAGLVAAMLPAPLRPRQVNGFAVAGICLIRLGSLRPTGLPAGLGMCSENAAHRIAVEWDDDGVTRQGVYIPARRTSSRATTLLGGRVFPGMHERSAFTVAESPGEVSVAFQGRPGDDVAVDVAASVVEAWPGGDLFADLRSASDFFAGGGSGYSATRDPGRLDGLELRTDAWSVQPAVVTRARSSFYDDPDVFPPGSIALDVALLMRDLPVTWHGLPSLRIKPVIEPVIEPGRVSVPGPRV